MPNVPELQDQALKWQKRISALAGQGLPTQPIQQLAQSDLNRLVQGGSPLSEEEVTNQVYSAYTGQSEVRKQTSPGTDWNPLHIASHFLSDISMDVRSFPEGLIHMGADIINPSKWEQIPGDIGKAGGAIASGDISGFAKDVMQTPIVGNLVPGMFALSAGTSGATQHPLNFLLDLLPFAKGAGELATIGVSAEEAGVDTAMSSLKNGHPLQALMRATGAESKLTDMLGKAGGPIGQLQYQPVWKAYNSLARTYSKYLSHSIFDELVSGGILPKNMSKAERTEITELAHDYNPRYESLPQDANLQNVAISNGDKATAFGNLDPNGDVVVYTPATETGQLTNGAVYFSKEQALQAAVGDVQQAIQNVDPQVLQGLVNEGRAPIQSLTFANGTWSAKDILPNRFQTTDRVIHIDDRLKTTLNKIDAFSEKYRSTKPSAEGEVKRSTDTKDGIPSDGKQKPYTNVVIPGPNGRPQAYHRNSLPVKTHEAMAAKAKEADTAVKELIKVQREHKRLEAVFQGLKSKRFQQFGESAEKASARPATLPSIAQLGIAANSYLQRLKDMGQGKLAARLEDAFTTKNITKVRTALMAIKKAVKDDPEALKYANYLYQESRGLGAQDTMWHQVQRKVQDISKRWDDAAEKVGQSKLALEDAQRAHYEALTAEVPGSAMPLLTQQARQRVKQQVTKQFIEQVRQAGEATAISQIVNKYKEDLLRIASGDETQLSNVVGEDTLKEVLSTAKKDWTDMQKAGYDPIWIHEVSKGWAEKKVFGSVRPLTVTDTGIPKTEVQRMFDFTPRNMDIAIALPAGAAEWLKQEATHQFIDFMLHSKYVHTTQDLINDITKRYQVTPEEAFKTIQSEYTKFKPHEFHDGYDPSAEYWMPAAIQNGFNQLRQGSRIPFKAEYNASLKVFKIATLSGPRHMVHVGIGGLVMQGIRDPGGILQELAHPMEVFKMAKTGEVPDRFKEYLNPQYVAQEIQKGNYERATDPVVAVSTGKKFADWLVEGTKEGELEPMDLLRAPENLMKKFHNFEALTTDFYRAGSFLHEVASAHRKARGTFDGMGANMEAAIAKVNKIFIDVDALTPFEQTTMKALFPFWTFTRHVLQYVLTLPADHPMRANVLARVAQHVEDQHNGTTDPTRLEKLFFLGTPDQFGNVKTVDMSNINPFRSIGSFFSMSGFLSGLNPYFQTGLKLAGINPLTGTAAMHPNLTYSQYLGKNVAKNPSPNVLDFVSSFIPEAEVADHFLLFTDTMRQLKQSNPEAYARSFWQSINFPFALAPINIYDLRAKAAQAQYADGQQAVSDAFKTGNTDGIRQYIAVPWQGYLYPSDALANYIDQWAQAVPGVAPKAVEKKPRTPRRHQVLT